DWPPLAGADSYEIHRDGAFLANSSLNGYFDEPGPGEHCYRIAGVNPCGVGPLSSEACGSARFGSADSSLVASIDASASNPFCTGMPAQFQLKVEHWRSCRLDSVRIIDLPDSAWYPATSSSQQPID